jgi:uncharacterized protein (DUF1501 family)
MKRERKLFAASRRNFLRAGAACGGVLAVGALAGKDNPFIVPAKTAPLPNHKRLVIINMLGGNDGLNTVFPVTGAVATKYQTRRPTIALLPASGQSLTGGPNVADYELHPSFVNLKTMWDANEVAIIQKVGYPSQNLSHFVSEDIWSWGARNGLASLSGVAPGWVARFANLYAPTAMGVASIGVGRRLDFEGATVSPLLVSSLTAFNFRSDGNYAANHVYRLQKAQAINALQPDDGSVSARAAAGMAACYSGTAGVQAAVAAYNTYATGAGIVYPNTQMGNRLRDVARLIHGGFESRVIYTGYGGFDTHATQQAAHANLFTQLDNALNIFRNDMMNMGVWTDVAVVVISEFGRRTYENGSVGTDHGHGSVVMLAGGTVNGGMYGGITSANMDSEHLGYDTDFRDVYRAIISGHFGEDPTPLFPEAQPTSNIPALF